MNSPRISDRALGTAAALLLQAGFIFLLLQAVQNAPAQKIIARELTLILPPLVPVRRVPAPAASAPTPTISRIRPDVTPSEPVPSIAPLAPIVPPASIQGFGQALNDCAPENYANLGPEQKALCARPGEGVAVQEAPNLMGIPSEVKHPERWAGALAHEQSPPWLPCMGKVATPVLSGGGGLQGGTGPMLNPLCLVQQFANGTLTDPATWPAYEVKQLQPEDFYKIQQTYDQWHKEHAKSDSGDGH